MFSRHRHHNDRNNTVTGEMFSFKFWRLLINNMI